MWPRVEIGLINIVEGDIGGHIEPTDVTTFTAAYTTRVNPTHTKDEARSAFLSAVFGSFKYPFRHRAGWFNPPEPYVAVKSLVGISWLLKELRGQHADSKINLTDDELSLVEAGIKLKATDEQCMLIASMLNRWADDAELKLGEPYNIFWITLQSAAAGALKGGASGRGKIRRRLRSRVLRDHLGLIQIGQEPLFAFRSKGPVSRAMRPTAFNGADNERFCQNEKLLGARPGGPWGLTTYMNGENTFAPGLQEAVVEGQQMKGQLRCIYIGRAETDPPGTDDGYRDYLLAGRNMAAINTHFGY